MPPLQRSKMLTLLKCKCYDNTGRQGGTKYPDISLLLNLDLLLMTPLVLAPSETIGQGA